MNTGIYDLKDEFFKLLGITMYQFRNKKENLLLWLNNFYDYELLPGKPIRIHIKAVYGEYQPLPAKVRDLTAEKIERYTQFAIAELGTEYKPNSKARVARRAIDAFGYNDYGHTSETSVGRHYVGPAMEKYGEHNNNYQWVWYHDYTPLDAESLAAWQKILKEEHISEQEAANAFYRMAEGEDIAKEKNCYRSAQKRFKDKYGSIPIKVAEWRLRND